MIGDHAFQPGQYVVQHIMRGGESAFEVGFVFFFVETQIDGLLERIVAAESPLVVGAFEKRINKLSEEKLAQEERIAKCGRPVRDFDDTLRTALGFLQNPYKLWVSEAVEDKRAVLKLIFGQPLRYIREKGFLEPELVLPFRALGGFPSSG